MSSQYLSGVPLSEKSMNGLITISDGSTEISDGNITTTNVIASGDIACKGINATGVLVSQPLSAQTYVPTLKLTNLQSPQPSIINMVLNAIAASANGCVQTGDSIIYSAYNPLCLTTYYPTGGVDCGMRLAATDIAFTGTTTTLGATTTNINGACMATHPSTGSVGYGTFNVRNSATPNPNLISFAPNLTGGSYNPSVIAGDSAIFSTPNNASVLNLTTFSATAVGVRINGVTSDVAISGTTTTLKATTTNINGVCNITSQTSATTITPTLVVQNTQTTPETINILLNALTTGAVNPFIATADNVIYSSHGTASDSNLCLTTKSATSCGIRIGPTDITTQTTTTNINATSVIYMNSLQTRVVNPQTTTSNQLAFALCNSRGALPDTIAFGVNLTAGSYNGSIIAGDSAIFATYSNVNTANLVLTTGSNIPSGVRITGAGAVTTSGLITNLTGDVTNINGLTSTNISTPTTTITGTTTNLNATSTNINGGCIIKNAQTATSAAQALVITNSIVSPNANTIAFSPNLGVGNYNPSVVAGDSAIFSGGAVGTSILNLTAHSNTAVGVRINANTSDVAISGTTTTLKATNTNITSTQTLITSPSIVTSSAPIFGMQTSVATSPYINFYTNMIGSFFNPAVTAGDAVISGGGGGGTNSLTLINGGSAVGTRLGITLASTYNYIQGLTYYTSPIRMNYTTTPTFVDYEIGYHLEPVGTSVYCPTVNQIYTGNSVVLTRGVWLVKGYCGIYSTINASRVYMSLSTSSLAHDSGNRVTSYQNAAAMTINGFEVSKVFVVPTAGTTIYVLVSSNLATTINPSYYVNYEVTRLA